MDLHEGIYVSIKQGQGMSFGQGISKNGFVIRFYNNLEPSEQSLISQVFLTPEAFVDLKDKFVVCVKEFPQFFPPSEPEQSV